MNDLLNSAFMRIIRRAEGVDPKILAQTFVNVGPLMEVLSTVDHQIVYGRRGTGKTHDLIYLSERMSSVGDIAVYIDLRTIGSSGGIYADPAVPFSERSTRLLTDTLEAIHSQLLLIAVADDSPLNLATLGPQLDLMAEAITRVVVIGDVEHEEVRSARSQFKSTTGTKLTVTDKGITAGIRDDQTTTEAEGSESRIRQHGQARHRVHFGSLHRALAGTVEALGGRRLWVLLDEWSTIPLDLQPYLADLIRHSLFPVRKLSVKIGAIEPRARFRLHTTEGDYIGIELGADAAADLNLDDFMVFDNNASAAIDFFQDLLFRHYLQDEDRDYARPATAQELAQKAFTQRAVFEELIKAAEGVPRDFINILAIAAQKAFRERIAIGHIRAAAKAWYQQDKGRAVNANQEASSLLHHIIDEVIGKRRTRAFLLRSELRNPLIDALFDARVLHLLKRNVSAKDEPGIRYDVYKIDYGCYVDLLTTSAAPQGLLLADFGEDGNVEYIDVPPDDYRAIRRAILTLPPSE